MATLGPATQWLPVPTDSPTFSIADGWSRGFTHAQTAAITGASIEEVIAGYQQEQDEMEAYFQCND